ncbi:MAG: hypothetical protein WCO60_18610 [Verrucomicrobiota bacterium]
MNPVFVAPDPSEPQLAVPSPYPKSRGVHAPNCRARLKGWLENVAARSTSWGDFDQKAFCKKTGYSREHVTRELSKLRKEGRLVFETKMRTKGGKGRKRWGVMVAHPKKLLFDGHSLFFDREGKQLHNYTTLGKGGEKIPPTDFIPKPKRPRGRPRKIVEEIPIAISAPESVVSEAEKTSVDERLECGVLVRKDGHCDSAKVEDYYVIQQSDLYGAGRGVAQWRGSGRGERRSKAGALRGKAFGMLRQLEERHWDNCKVTFSRRCGFSFVLGALTNGHKVDRILSCYSDALYVTHGFAVDRAASSGKIVFFNLSSTVVKARKLLAKDGLTRLERMSSWYQSNEVTKAEIAGAFRELRLRFGAELLATDEVEPAPTMNDFSELERWPYDR